MSTFTITVPHPECQAVVDDVRAHYEAENERLRTFAENVRDNWGVLTGYELERDARAALGERQP